MGEAMGDTLIHHTNSRLLHNLDCCEASARILWPTMPDAASFCEVALQCSRVRLISSYCFEYFY